MKSESDYQNLVDSAFRLISFRPRSEKEIADFLQKKNSRLAETVLARMRELGYVDDVKFAQWWIEVRQGRKPKGMQLIIHELLSKGVAREIVEQVLSSEIGNQEELAKKALDRKIRTVQDKKKLMDYLLRRGFDARTARHAIDESLEKR